MNLQKKEAADFDWGDEVSEEGGISAELYWERKVVLEFGKKVESLFCDWIMLCCWVFGDKNSKKIVSVCIGKWMDESTLSCICIEWMIWTRSIRKYWLMEYGISRNKSKMIMKIIEFMSF